MDFIGKVKGFLFEPSNAFNNSGKETLFEAFKFYFILFLFYSVLETLVQIFFGDMIVSLMGKYAIVSDDTGIKEIIKNSISDILYAIPEIFIGVAPLHFSVYIAGGKKGINQTLKAFAYSSTPALLFGWIPVINIPAGLWSLVLSILGIRELQEISTKRALLAVLVPYILLLLMVAVVTKTILLPGIKIPLS